MPNHEFEVPIASGRQRRSAGHNLLQWLTVQQAKTLRSDYLRGLWRHAAAWYQARAAVEELHGLDDAALKDIGLHRSGIEAAVYKETQPAAGPCKREAFPEKRHLLLQTG